MPTKANKSATDNKPTGEQTRTVWQNTKHTLTKTTDMAAEAADAGSELFKSTKHLVEASTMLSLAAKGEAALKLQETMEELRTKINADQLKSDVTFLASL